MRTGAAGLPQQLYPRYYNTGFGSTKPDFMGYYWQFRLRGVPLCHSRSTVRTWPSNKELSKNHPKINHNSVLLKKLLLTGARLFSGSKSVLDFLKRESQRLGGVSFAQIRTGGVFSFCFSRRKEARLCSSLLGSLGPSALEALDSSSCLKLTAPGIQLN